MLTKKELDQLREQTIKTKDFRHWSNLEVDKLKETMKMGYGVGIIYKAKLFPKRSYTSILQKILTIREEN